MKRLITDRRSALLLVAVGVAFALTSAGRGQCQYEVTAVFEGPMVWGRPAPISIGGMNEQGHIVGHYNVIFGDEAFLWTPEEGLVTLPRLLGSGSARAYDINDDGVIVGYMEQTDSNLYTACMWKDGEVIDLGYLPDGNNSQASAINNAGQIVGDSHHNVSGPRRAVLWEDGEIIDLSGFFDTKNSQAYGINDKGQITGWMGTSTVYDSTAFVLDGGQVTSLPMFPGGTGAYGRDINDRSWVVGACFADFGATPSVARHATLYRSGRVTDLGILPGDVRSLATDINLTGQAVGYSDQFHTGYHAVLWQNGYMSAIDDLVAEGSDLEFYIPGGVNDAGQIATSALDPSWNLVGVLLTLGEAVSGDVNLDCTVNIDDLFAVLGYWGPCEGCPEDLNEDGIVNIKDLLMVIMNWG